MEDMMQVKMVMTRDVTTMTMSLGIVIEAALPMLSVDESLLPTGEIAPPMECMIPMFPRMILDAAETLSVVVIEVGVIEGTEMSSVDVHHLEIDLLARGWSLVQCSISLQEHQSQLAMIIRSLKDVSKVYS
jgi:hypothetical protein